MYMVPSNSFVDSQSGSAVKAETPVMECREANVYYGSFQALKHLNLPIYRGEVTAFIGPSGCGKSTLLRCFNRMNDFIDSFRVEGEILLYGQDVNSMRVDPVDIRLRIGMVFQQPNPFPKSIHENIALAPRINGYTGNIDQLVEESLKRAYLWDEVKDKLHQNAYSLSGGQQQRLCIARSIAMGPEVLLMDEPTAALDPISTGKIEDLVKELVKSYTIVIVTHNMQQAARISNRTAFFYQGEIVEFDYTRRIFTDASHKLTSDYVAGRFG